MNNDRNHREIMMMHTILLYSLKISCILSGQPVVFSSNYIQREFWAVFLFLLLVWSNYSPKKYLINHWNLTLGLMTWVTQTSIFPCCCLWPLLLNLKEWSNQIRPHNFARSVVLCHKNKEREWIRSRAVIQTRKGIISFDDCSFLTAINQWERPSHFHDSNVRQKVTSWRRDLFLSSRTVSFFFSSSLFSDSHVTMSDIIH